MSESAVDLQTHPIPTGPTSGHWVQNTTYHLWKFWHSLLGRVALLKIQIGKNFPRMLSCLSGHPFNIRTNHGSNGFLASRFLFYGRRKSAVTEAYVILSSCPSSTSTSGDDEVVGTGFNPPPKTPKNYTEQVKKMIQDTGNKQQRINCFQVT